MKYFLFADPHGHYTELKEALLAAGYDETNDNHHLIGLGDYFDRGNENKEMLEFLMNQKEKGKATYILGNHDEMLLDFLTFNDDGKFNMLQNGLDRTIENLSNWSWHEAIINQKFIVDKILNNFPDIIKFLQSMEDIIEIKDFVLTHAGYGNKYKDPYRTDVWEVNRWTQSNYFVKWFAMADQFKINKTYIFGHWHAFQLRQEFQKGDGKITPEPFIHRNFIGLDACTVLTKKVNIYIIDEEVV